MRETAGSALLEWYDTHARTLPWRVAPEDRARGEAPDPYAVWLSEIMLQQTTVAAVGPYFHRFMQRWPTVDHLAQAQDADVMAEWAGLGYYARARNLLRCARVVSADFGGRFPDEEAALLTLPGVGPYTAAAVAAIAFDRPALVVDGNVERVITRAFDIDRPTKEAKAQIKANLAQIAPASRPGDFAQAMMDLGATICTPKSPACGICPLIGDCAARAAGTQAQRPVKSPKVPKPTRLGIAYVAVRNDGAVLLETRPETGLLGGMLGWPTSDWSDAPSDQPPLGGAWWDARGEVRHTFTHFHLRLAVRILHVGMNANAARGEFVPRANFRPGDLPTLMRKVWDMAQAGLEAPPATHRGVEPASGPA